MKKLLVAGLAIAVIGGVLGWYLSAPKRVSDADLAQLGTGDPVNGELLFWAGGCASCHAAKNSKGDELLKLAGGLRLETPFGVFIAPNISSSSAHGIGGWSVPDFVNAMTHGTSPNGKNYYPAFPYTSYARMTQKDLADLFAFMKTLPAVEATAADHELSFPFNIRRGLGLWKRVFLDPDPVIPAPGKGDDLDLNVWKRGRYLVEGPGHCGECHTPRNFAGGLILSDWLGGASAAAGEGKVPDITPGGNGFGSWSTSDIAYYLESGFTPEYDSVGGEMVHVQENMARLPSRDRVAIATYLKAIPAVVSSDRDQ